MTREELLTWIPYLEADADRRGLDTYAMVANRAIAMLRSDGEAIAALEAERDRLKAALSKSKQTAERWRADCMYFWSMS